MSFKFHSLRRSVARANDEYKFNFQFNLHNQSTNSVPHHQPRIRASLLLHSVADSDNSLTGSQKQNPDDQIAFKLQNLLKDHINRPTEVIEHALNKCELVLTDDLVLNVLRRHQFDWKPAYVFFKWTAKDCKYSPGCVVYNEILDILGRMHRFDDLIQLFDEMSKRDGLMDEQTYNVLLSRYAAAHRVQEAIFLFYKREEFGLELDLAAFQKLLMWLCRHKHVEDAETLFHSKKRELGFVYDIKTWNIILNGWCVLGNVHEAKRFWKDIIASKCKPDLYTYGTFINALTKKGKLGTALELFRAMWDKGCKPDKVICNCIIDALCFKKRIPEALEVFREMRERGCEPNVVTYNSLIKHLCKIRRMDKVYELLDEMEQHGGSCLPSDVTFHYLLKSAKKAEEVPWLMERMKRNRCNMTCNTYNLILKLYIEWDCEEKVKCTWNDMQKIGLGPDRRSYTIMIHGLYDKGRIEDALHYFTEMTSKGIIPEPRTNLLVNSINTALQEGKANKGKKMQRRVKNIYVNSFVK